jgi:LacI family transcriptional regulator
MIVNRLQRPKDVMTGLSSEQQQPRVTIYDVARLAQVSPSTVSRALNKPGRLTAETERKVREAAERLEFEINPSARALQTGRRMTLALMLADITNPVVFGIIRGAERGAAAAGYSLIIAESQESGESELKMLRKIQASVDGLVLATTRVSAQSIQQFARALPVVLVNRAESAVASIVPDVRGGVAQLLDHLQAYGHANIAYLSGPAASWMNSKRWAALVNLAPSRRMRVFEIPCREPTMPGGAEALERVMLSPATAVIAFNDLMALGLLRAARQEKVAVPGRISVAGFDNIFGAELTTPALTTIAAPLEDAGAQAVESLVALIEGSSAGLPEVSPFELQLVVRDSTGPIAAID